MARPTLHLHKAGTGYIGQLTAEDGVCRPAEDVAPPQMALIMDNSGSMGPWSQRMLNTVFPQMLDLMGFRPEDRLLVVLFSNQASHHHLRVQDLPRFDAGRQGATQMRGVYGELQTQLDHANPCVQVLALSDGAVHDQQQTADAAALAAGPLRSSYQIEARAVRLFTSQCGQPDTRALASVLQLNTDSAAALVDLHGDVPLEDMARTMAGMFGGGRGRSFLLRTSGGPALQSDPWDEPKGELRLRLGRNTFWLTEAPQEPTLNGEPLEVLLEAPMNQDTMGLVLKDRLEFFTSQLRVLKVIDTEQAKAQIARIVGYFKALEASLAPAEELAPLLAGGGLRGRADFLRKTLQRRMRSATTMLESIANDDRVRLLNQAQQADYLRQAAVSKNARALAKRAEAAGMDFDATLRREILQMRAHLEELDQIGTRGHAVSFYSQASTVDGIREVCAMAEDSEVFEGLLAVDLLQVFNVVGVPAVGPIADYPDPMTYRVDELVPGSYISVADLSICELAGGKLKAPGTETVINNAIPIFEDLRVQRFLQRYAPSALEYICSIGMRRVLAEVPQTFPYTVCAAVWNLIQRLDTEKSELNVTLLGRMAPAYHESLQGRFDYLMPLLETSQDEEKSYFLSHNGITNMISPIWRLVAEDKAHHMPRILRALYTFETFQAMRRLCRPHDAKFAVRQLDRLLGVDFEVRGTPLPERFSRSEPIHCQEVHLDRALFTELCEEKPVAKAKYAILMVPLFRAVLQKDPVAQARAIPQLSEEAVVSALGLDYPLEEFLLYNIVEGFLFQSKQSRVDKDTNESLRPDLGSRRAGQEMVREYLRERYSQDYEYRLKQMAGEEREQLCTELIGSLADSASTAAFNDLLSKGLTRGAVTFKIENFNSYGCLELHSALLDLERKVPRRAEKLQVFYTGEDAEGGTVWNGGNMYRASFAPVQEVLAGLGEEATFERIVERSRAKRSHVYRGGQCSCNRHGHSNDLPSYFAFGHDSLLSYAETVSTDAWAQYRQEHRGCCGVARILLDAERLAAKRARRVAASGEGDADASIARSRLGSLIAELRGAQLVRAT